MLHEKPFSIPTRYAQVYLQDTPKCIYKIRPSVFTRYVPAYLQDTIQRIYKIQYSVGTDQIRRNDYTLITNNLGLLSEKAVKTTSS